MELQKVRCDSREGQLIDVDMVVALTFPGVFIHCSCIFAMAQMSGEELIAVKCESMQHCWLKVYVVSTYKKNPITSSGKVRENPLLPCNAYNLCAYAIVNNHMINCTLHACMMKMDLILLPYGTDWWGLMLYDSRAVWALQMRVLA